MQARDDLPRLIRAGRHIARTKRYIRHLGIEIEPDQLVGEIETQAAAGDGWVKLAADWIDREVGDLAPRSPTTHLPQVSPGPTNWAYASRAHVFGEDALPGADCGPESIRSSTGRASTTS